jgi:hypothetical protein
VGQARRRLKELIIKRHQVGPLHGTAPLDAVTVNRFDHDSLAASFAKHFGNAIAVPYERSAGWSTANAGSGAFHRHRARRFFCNKYDYAHCGRMPSAYWPWYPPYFFKS